MSERTTETALAGTANAPAIRLCGASVVPDVSGVLYLPSHETLIVADLHFEKGSAFAARGVHLPPYDTRSTLVRLRQVISAYAPARVVALGDSFHDDGAGARIADDDARAVRAATAGLDWVWITGNHDPNPPAALGGRVCDELDLEPFLLRHIPRSAPATGEIAGHLHPVATVASRGRRLRRRCFVCDGTRMILPAFGAYTGGLNVNTQPFADVFGGAGFTAWMLGRDRVYPVSSRRLTGTV